MESVVQETWSWTKVQAKVEAKAATNDGGYIAVLQAWAADLISQADEEKVFSEMGLGGLIAGVHP